MSLILALDVGYKATGCAVFDTDLVAHPEPLRVCCYRPKKSSGKQHTYVADKDVAHISIIAQGLSDLVDEFGIKRVVAEIPSGGSQGARANRCMAIATGMIATLQVTKNLAVEYYSQGDTRKAGLGSDVYMMDILGKKANKSMLAKEKKALKRERDKAKRSIKKRIMENMVKKYPSLEGIDIADLEHIADACSTFEAAKSGNLVRMA